MSHPALTVALLTPDTFATIRKTVSHVAAQSIAEQIELLILAPATDRLTLDAGATSAFHSVRIVCTDFSAGTGQARATAVRVASAAIIVFGEDHCFPEAGWAKALLRAHDGQWAAVGPVVRNANPDALVSWADLLMGYGSWLAPGRSIERDHLPGHNSSYKVSALLTLGDSLARLMESETALQWRLRSQGYRLYQEADAHVAHTNFDSWKTWIPVSFHAGRVFAATRSLGWSLTHRLVFAAGTPLVPLVRMWRHVRQALNAGLSPLFVARVAPVLAIGLLVDGTGQLVGLLAGAGQSRVSIVEWDFHRNAPRATAQATGAAQA